ncbi:MAG: hypothetical protein IJ420_00475, partial [Lachnospiraceae bacterium]|nr:hypothetical protein [Lachnospiraceae bacterium]
GLKERRGKLHINGDVDVPDLHWENLKDITIPVHISEGEGISWMIAAKAFTPGQKELVKTLTVPMGTAGAEIKLSLAEDFGSRVSEELKVYLEVAALGFDVHGERNLIEKMVEVTIVRKEKGL